MLDYVLEFFRSGQEGTEMSSQSVLSRRELLGSVPRDLALLGGLAWLLRSSDAEAATLKKLGNYPVMDMDGRYRDYYKKDAPVLDVPRTEIHRSPAGILNYLKWEGNPRAGKPALIQFGSHWCSPCGANMPFLEHIYQNQKYRDIQVVGVSVADPEVEPLEVTVQKTKAKIGEKRATYPNLLMTAGAMNTALLEHVPEGSMYPQVLVVNMPSGEVTYITKYLFEHVEGRLGPSAEFNQLYREFEKLRLPTLPVRQTAAVPPEHNPANLLDRINALRDRIERSKPKAGQ